MLCDTLASSAIWQYQRVRLFHVQQFHALLLRPFVSRPTISCPVILSVRFFHVLHFQSTPGHGVFTTSLTLSDSVTPNVLNYFITSTRMTLLFVGLSVPQGEELRTLKIFEVFFCYEYTVRRHLYSCCCYRACKNARSDRECAR